MFDIGIDKKMIGVGGVIGVLVAGSLAAPIFFPRAFAAEPTSPLLGSAEDLFRAPFDMSRLKKFDIALDDSVSTQITHSQIVKKISFGQKKVVSIVTTPSGTYSSDALTSPNVKYPGISVKPRQTDPPAWTYQNYASPAGGSETTSMTSGSFTYMTYSFKPKADANT